MGGLGRGRQEGGGEWTARREEGGLRVCEEVGSRAEGRGEGGIEEEGGRRGEGGREREGGEKAEAEEGKDSREEKE